MYEVKNQFLCRQCVVYFVNIPCSICMDKTLHAQQNNYSISYIFTHNDFIIFRSVIQSQKERKHNQIKHIKTRKINTQTFFNNYLT